MRLGPRPRPARRPRAFAGWPDGNVAALSFSFDDARPSQTQHGLALLERVGVAATFFVLPDAVAADVASWRSAAGSFHEIGSHTATHPCSANMAWSRGNALEEMSLAGFRRYGVGANRRLHELIGIEPRVFAYPCGQTFVGTGRRTRSLVPPVARLFDVGRSYNDVSSNAPAVFDPAHVLCVNSDGRSLEGLLPTLEATVADGAWLVLGGHEVGADADFETTTTATIAAVAQWCRSNRVWVDTVGRVAAAALAPPTRSR